MKKQGDSHSHIIIEYRELGRFAKVSAIDSITHEEVSIVGDPRQGREHLSRLAIRKLKHMQSKR